MQKRKEKKRLKITDCINILDRNQLQKILKREITREQTVQFHHQLDSVTSEVQMDYDSSQRHFQFKLIIQSRKML